MSGGWLLSPTFFLNISSSLLLVQSFFAQPSLPFPVRGPHHFFFRMTSPFLLTAEAEAEAVPCCLLLSCVVGEGVLQLARGQQHGKDTDSSTLCYSGQREGCGLDLQQKLWMVFGGSDDDSRAWLLDLPKPI